MHNREISLRLRFFQIAADGFAAALVALGKLCGCLFAVGVEVPEMFGIQAVSTVEILATVLAYILLSPLIPPILFDLF